MSKRKQIEIALTDRIYITPHSLMVISQIVESVIAWKKESNVESLCLLLSSFQDKELEAILRIIQPITDRISNDFAQEILGHVNNPSWEYYIIWHQLNSIKAFIYQAMKQVEQSSICTEATDYQITRNMLLAKQAIEGIKIKHDYLNEIHEENETEK